MLKIATWRARNSNPLLYHCVINVCDVSMTYMYEPYAYVKLYWCTFFLCTCIVLAM